MAMIAAMAMSVFRARVIWPLCRHCGRLHRHYRFWRAVGVSAGMCPRRAGLRINNPFHSDRGLVALGQEANRDHGTGAGATGAHCWIRGAQRQGIKEGRTPVHKS